MHWHTDNGQWKKRGVASHLLDALLVLRSGLGAAFERRDGGEELLLQLLHLLAVVLPFPREERWQEGEGRHAGPPPAVLAPDRCRRRGQREAWHSAAPAEAQRESGSRRRWDRGLVSTGSESEAGPMTRRGEAREAAGT
jgi:hypothetical protein